MLIFHWLSQDGGGLFDLHSLSSISAFSRTTIISMLARSLCRFSFFCLPRELFKIICHVTDLIFHEADPTVDASRDVVRIPLPFMSLVNLP